MYILFLEYVLSVLLFSELMSFSSWIIEITRHLGFISKILRCVLN